MARSRNTTTLTIATLEHMLDARRRRLQTLLKEQARMQKQLNELNRKIASLSGGNINPAGATRAHNSKSLVATIEAVLSQSGKPLGVGEILSRVRSAGYHSNSANFRALINQTLIKDKRFTSAGRGVYQLKK